MQGTYEIRLDPDKGISIIPVTIEYVECLVFRYDLRDRATLSNHYNTGEYTEYGYSENLDPMSSPDVTFKSFHYDIAKRMAMM